MQFHQAKGGERMLSECVKNKNGIYQHVMKTESTELSSLPCHTTPHKVLKNMFINNYFYFNILLTQIGMVMLSCLSLIENWWSI